MKYIFQYRNGKNNKIFESISIFDRNIDFIDL